MEDDLHLADGAGDELGVAQVAAQELDPILASGEVLLATRREIVEDPHRPATFDQAIREETRLGLEVIRSGETAEGAKRFATGAGRHGSFD